ncbi:hypothetical protein [Pelosinus sp. sgz500959]|uniref:hypothetical protein n=1 Tax=Pelosinus sp. sgz500959 TaxID=3242472 RepID=UPI00366BC641
MAQKTTICPSLDKWLFATFLLSKKQAKHGGGEKFIQYNKKALLFAHKGRRIKAFTIFKFL